MGADDAMVGHVQYRAYLLQRASGTRQWQFSWVDDRWPSCAVLRGAEQNLVLPSGTRSESVLDSIVVANPGIPEQTWTRYLARISYCAAICLHPDEAVDAVLHAEVGDVEGPRADAVRGHLERAVAVLRLEGMMEPELSLRVVGR